MGDSITEGTIVDLPVAPGDYVQTDDVVVVLETDKVSVDVRAPEGLHVRALSGGRPLGEKGDKDKETEELLHPGCFSVSDDLQLY